MSKSPVLDKWMINLGLRNTDLNVFAFIYYNPKCTLDDIADYYDIRKDSVKRNVNALIARSQIVEKSHKLCIAQDIDILHDRKKETASNGKLFDTSAKKQGIDECRKIIKGKIDTFVMHNCGNNQELRDLLLEYMKVTGTSKTKLNEHSWDRKLDDLLDIDDKIQSVKQAIAGQYKTFYPPKKQFAKSTSRSFSNYSDDDKYNSDEYLNDEPDPEFLM